MMKYQIVIPARGGSKRFPGKNLISLDGKPLIAHSIDYGKLSGMVEEVYVNTDDPEIGKVAEEHGAVVTWRPGSLGGDNVPTVDVLQYQVDFFRKNNVPCDAIILLQATNPLRPKNLLPEAVKAFENSGRNSLTTFTTLPRKFGTISDHRFVPENYAPGQRMQDLIPRYFENGMVYITRCDAIMEGEIITSDTYPMVVDSIESTVDIDEPDDLIYAEFIRKKLNEDAT